MAGGRRGHDVQREGDRLVVEGTCPMFLSDWCNVRYTIEMPSSAVVADTDNGRVTVTEWPPTSRRHRTTADRAGPHEGDLVLHSDNGSVTATGIRGPHARATSDNGGVRLGLDSPHDVVATSDNGSVDIVILDEGAIAYKVDAESDNGTVSFPVRTDPDGERTITAHSDNGDVTITYALHCSTCGGYRCHGIPNRRKLGVWSGARRCRRGPGRARRR